MHARSLGGVRFREDEHTHFFFSGFSFSNTPTDTTGREGGWMRCGAREGSLAVVQ